MKLVELPVFGADIQTLDDLNKFPNRDYRDNTKAPTQL
jgi:hypothetical protein